MKLRVFARWSVGLLCALLLAGCGPSAPHFSSTDVTGATFGQDFRLTDHTGKTRTLADYRGRVVVVFFGFTQCPDVCPTTLAGMADVMKRLGPDASRVQVLFVTLDPERDTPALLAQYVPQFHPSFIGLYTDTSGTAALARDFKVFFQKTPTGSSYTIDHSTGSYIYDPQGRLRLYTQHAASPEAIASDIKQLLTAR